MDLSRIGFTDPGGLRRDPGRRHGRGVPDREPGPDAEPAADPAREPRRPDHPGRPHPPRAGQRRRRAPLREAPPRPARGPRRSSRPTTTPCSPTACARRSAWSSSRSRCSRWRWRWPASAPGQAEALRRAMSRKRSREAMLGPVARVPRRRAGARGRRRDHPHGLPEADRLLQLRLPQGPLGGLRRAGLPERVAAPALSGRVPGRAAERPAHGLLPPGQPGARRPAARRARAAALRPPLAGGLRRGGRRGAGRPRLRARGAPRTPPSAWWPSARPAGPSATWPTWPRAPTCAASSSPSSCAPAPATPSSARAGRCSGSSASLARPRPAAAGTPARRCRSPPRPLRRSPSRAASSAP